MPVFHSLVKLILTLCLLPLVAEARSGWVSSGGELFRFDKNPWFVKNTKEVRYCVQFDSAGFSVPRDSAEEAIEEAIRYWKTELTKVNNDHPGFAKIGTQRFVKVADCAPDLDLKFKLGYSTLDNEEIEFLKDPQKYVGVSVRTSPYDHVQMRAKGFIFISSDRGEKAYHNPGHLISEAWSQPQLLKYALIHELGHVFGIPHTGVGIMSEVFLDQLLHKRLTKYYATGPLKSYMHPPTEMLICTLNGSFNPSFFQVPADTACLKMLEDGINTYKVFALKSLESEPEEVGEVKITQPSQKAMAAKPVTIIHLPPEQEVYGVKERFVNNYMIGPLIADYGARGFYRTKDSRKPYPLHLELQPESVTMLGQVSGKITSVLEYAPPTLMRLTLPF